MIDGKTFFNLFSDKLGFEESVSDVVYAAFLAELKNKLNDGQTAEIEGVGFFKRKDSETLIFVNEKGSGEKLFEEIKLPAENVNEFELNENVFAVGGESPVLSADDITDAEKVSRLEEKLNRLAEEIDSYKILDDFDPLEYSQSKSEDSETDESWHDEIKEELLSEDLFDDDESFEEENEEESAEENQDEKNNIVDELNAEINEEMEKEEENAAPEETEENTEESEAVEDEEEKENLENDVIDQEDLDKVFGEDEDDKPDDEKKTDKKEKKKKFKLFGKKKEKKEKKPKKKKEKKKKKKGKDKDETEDVEKNESGENEENAEKKKLSTKLIILIAVFVVVTLGGVYYFFFMGEDEPPEEAKTEAVDTTKAERTPITPEELGARKDKTGKIEVDVHNPEKTKAEDSYNFIDPRLMKEFPHEKKLTNKIYFSDGKYMVQLSSWRDSERASQIVEKLYENGFNAFVVKAFLPQLGGTWYRVRIGFFDTLKEAKEFLKKREYLHVR